MATRRGGNASEDTSGGTPGSLALTINWTGVLGDTRIVYFACYTGTAGSFVASNLTVSDNGSPTNTYGSAAFFTPEARGVFSWFFILPSVANTNATTLTATLNGANAGTGAYIHLVADDFFGIVNSSAALAATNFTRQTSLAAGTDAVVSGTVTTVQGDLVYGVTVADTPSLHGDGTQIGTNFTAGSGTGGSGNFDVASEYRTTSSAGTYQATFTNAGTDNYDTFVLAFSHLAGGPGPPCLKGSQLILGFGCWAASKLAQNPRLTRRDLFVPRKSLVVPQREGVTRQGLFVPSRGRGVNGY